MPSMAPSQAGPAPIAARNAGRTAVAVSWLQSLKRLVRPTPRTVRLSQDCCCEDSGMGESLQSTVYSSEDESMWIMPKEKHRHPDPSKNDRNGSASLGS